MINHDTDSFYCLILNEGGQVLKERTRAKAQNGIVRASYPV